VQGTSNPAEVKWPVSARQRLGAVLSGAAGLCACDARQRPAGNRTQNAEPCPGALV